MPVWGIKNPWKFSDIGVWEGWVSEWVLSKFNGTPTPKGSYSAKTGDNHCNVNSSHYSLSTALCESIRYQAKSEQNVRQDPIPRVRHGEAALCTPRYSIHFSNYWVVLRECCFNKYSLKLSFFKYREIVPYFIWDIIVHINSYSNFARPTFLNKRITWDGVEIWISLFKYVSHRRIKSSFMWFFCSLVNSNLLNLCILRCSTFSVSELSVGKHVAMSSSYNIYFPGC